MKRCLFSMWFWRLGSQRSGDHICSSCCNKQQKVEGKERGMHDKGKTWEWGMLYNNALLALIQYCKSGNSPPPPKKTLMSSHPPYPKKPSLIPTFQHGHMEDLRFSVSRLLGRHIQIAAQSTT